MMATTGQTSETPVRRARLTRLCRFKAALWFIIGAAAVLAVLRFLHGLGATTALTDLTPWGFWIGFDVMGGVALAAGGFVVAATVYVFHLERYHAIVRPAVLTAFLGYLAVIGGLLFDVGLPWNLWHMIIYWNPHSPLFEVGWCVMLYTLVLSLEFAPVVLESAKHPTLARVYNLLKKATIPLVILGIMLSTLHQSSLGSLMLIMPHRLHPLWYTPILPLLFFISAIGLGLMMVTTEALFSAYLYEHEPEMELLKGLGKAASVVLWIYFVIKMVDLSVRDQIGALFQPSFESVLFWIECLLSALIPAMLLSIRRVREHPIGLGIAVGTGVIGFVMNRIDVGGLATVAVTGTRYVPSWMEVVISCGVVAAAALAFFFVAEHFHLFHAGPVRADEFRHALPEWDPGTMVVRPDPYTWGPARYSAMAVLGAAVALALVPDYALSGGALRDQPVTPPGFGDRIVLDGNRTGLAVVFKHTDHVSRTHNCALCHHMVRPEEQATGCSHCHRDMERETNIFDHSLHAKRVEQGPGCSACHDPGFPPGDASHTKPCLQCHTKMVPSGATIKPKSAPWIGRAPGYKEAMHGLCIPCHKQKASAEKPALWRCATCHPASGTPAFDPLRPDERGNMEH